jgi:hypothetical protein
MPLYGTSMNEHHTSPLTTVNKFMANQPDRPKNAVRNEESHLPLHSAMCLVVPISEQVIN